MRDLVMVTITFFCFGVTEASLALFTDSKKVTLSGVEHVKHNRKKYK